MLQPDQVSVQSAKPQVLERGLWIVAVLFVLCFWGLVIGDYQYCSMHSEIATRDVREALKYGTDFNTRDFANFFNKEFDGGAHRGRFFSICYAL